MNRARAIAKATMLEALRSPVAPVAALLLLALAPGLAGLLGADAGSRAWLSRVIPAEAFRILLPLGVIVGGAFLLKPNIRGGWAMLPARRAEWFIGNAAAGLMLLATAVALIAAGGAIAALMFGTPLIRTADAISVASERVHDGGIQRSVFASGTAWADPETDSWIVVELPPGLKHVAGTLEFLPVLTGEAAPGTGSPVALWLEAGESRVAVATKPESRRRVSFQADIPGEGRMVARAVDPALMIGTSASRIRFETGTQSPLRAVATLALVSFGACALCLCLVLSMRAIATAPTAALAGMLLLAAFTLLPALAPAESMARDRRGDMQGGQPQRSIAQALEEDLAQLPPLFPGKYFDDYLSGHAVPAVAQRDGLLRLAAGLLLLLPGAALFTRRQMAK